MSPFQQPYLQIQHLDLIQRSVSVSPAPLPATVISMAKKTADSRHHQGTSRQDQESQFCIHDCKIVVEDVCRNNFCRAPLLLLVSNDCQSETTPDKPNLPSWAKVFRRVFPSRKTLRKKD